MMKKSILFSTMVFCSFALAAQERVREAGITFWNLDNFGFTYRTGNPEALWRFSTIGVFNTRDSEDDDETKRVVNNLSISIGAGREFRKAITENLAIRYGAELGLGRWRHEDKTTFLDNDQVNIAKRKTFSTAIRGVLGLIYVVSEKLVIGAEALPGVTYRTGEQVSEYAGTVNRKDISTFNFELSSSSLLMSIAYRF